MAHPDPGTYIDVLARRPSDRARRSALPLSPTGGRERCALIRACQGSAPRLSHVGSLSLREESFLCQFAAPGESSCCKLAPFGSRSPPIKHRRQTMAAPQCQLTSALHKRRPLTGSIRHVKRAASPGAKSKVPLLQVLPATAHRMNRGSAPACPQCGATGVLPYAAQHQGPQPRRLRCVPL